MSCTKAQVSAIKRELDLQEPDCIKILPSTFTTTSEFRCNSMDFKRENDPEEKETETNHASFGP